MNVNVNLKPPFLILSILLEVKTDSTAHNEVKQGHARSFGGFGQNGEKGQKGGSKKNHKPLPICDVISSKCSRTEPTDTLRYLR